MFSDNALTDRIELGRARPTDGLAFRPDLENVSGTLGFRAAPHGGTDNPDRRGATGVFRVHHPGTIFKITGVGSIHKDERRRYGAAAFALHVSCLKAKSFRVSEFLHNRPEEGNTLRVQRVLGMAWHQTADTGAPAAPLNPYASHVAQGAVMEYMLAETVVVNILRARHFRGKQRRRQKPCTVSNAVKGNGPVEPLQHFPLRVLASALAHQPNPLALSKPIQCRILSLYTINEVTGNRVRENG
jgi:hypothetical protein